MSALESSLEGRRLGRDPYDVKEGHRARRGSSRPQCFELIFARLHLKTRDHRDTILGDLTHQMTEHRVKRIVSLNRERHVYQTYQYLACSVLGQVQPDGRHPAGDGTANVQQIGITLGARAQHRIGEGDGVGLAPGDLLAEAGPHLGLIGGTRPGRNTAHALIGNHLPVGVARPVGGNGPFVPVVLVQATDVQCGRHDDASAQTGQTLGKFQASLTDVDGAVDVGRRDVHQLGRAINLGHLHQDRHGHLDGRAVRTVEHGAITIGKFQSCQSFFS